MFHLPRMTLPEGHRAAVPNFDTTARLGHVYTWGLHVARTSLDAAPAGEGDVSPLSLSRNRIWHQVELANGTDAPWTTGAVFVTRGGLPVAPELLAYIPRGGTVRVRDRRGEPVRNSRPSSSTLRQSCPAAVPQDRPAGPTGRRPSRS